MARETVILSYSLYFTDGEEWLYAGTFDSLNEVMAKVDIMADKGVFEWTLECHAK